MDESPQQMGVSLDVTLGPDGQHWPRLMFMVGTTAYTLTLPAESFVQFLQQLAEQGPKVIKECKRLNSPLQVAQAIPNGINRR